MRAKKPREIASAPKAKLMNVKVPPHIHARYLQECERLSQEFGGRFSLNMLFVRLGQTLPPTPAEDPQNKPPARATVRSVSAKSA
jgi:hypothetical protein